MGRTSTLFSALGCVFLHASLSAPLSIGNGPTTDAETASKAAHLVQNAMEAEGEGELLLRERLLGECDSLVPQFPPSLWLQGKVRNADGSWASVSEVIEHAQSNTLLHEYEQVRSEAAPNVAGNWQMAAWCAKNGLAPQARAHLLNIIQMDQDNVAARKALGHIQAGTEWLSIEDQQEIAEKAKRVQQGFEIYGDKVAKWLSDATNPANRNPTRALKQIRELADPLAIPAMERGAELHGKEAAKLVVEWLGTVDAPESALSLCRFGLSYPDADIKQLSIKQLRSKPLHDFIPELLESMSSPISFMTRPIFDATGATIGFSQAFAKENMTEKKFMFSQDLVTPMVIASTERSHRSRMQWRGRNPGAPKGFRNFYATFDPTQSALERELEALKNAVALELAAQAAAARTQAMQQKAKLENTKIEQRNRQVSTFISDVTLQEFKRVPLDLWHWWDDYNETDYQSTKYRRRRLKARNYVVPVMQSDIKITFGSCFVAGTKVLTSRGFKSIEHILPGDMVLSRSVQSGELCFKPVITATSRAPAKTVILNVNDEKIHATSSHLLWASGKGWTKAGDLKVGDILHAASEPAVVMATTESDVLPTHNLIVADYHTYFVGKSQILSHDVLPRGSCHEAIPGESAVSLLAEQ